MFLKMLGYVIASQKCGIWGCPTWFQVDPVHMWDTGVSLMVPDRHSIYFPGYNIGTIKEASKICNKHL